MSESELRDGSGDIDLPAIGRAVMRRRSWIIGATLVAFVGMTAFVMLVTPRYTGEAKILIESQETAYTRTEGQGADQSQTPPDDAAITSQVQVVMSRDVARQAIRALDLYGNPEFDPMAGGASLMSRLFSAIGLQSVPSPALAEDRILEAYFEHLSVQPVVKSRVLSIEFWSRDPALASRAANTVADLYINAQAAAKRDRARVAADSLANLIGELRGKVAEAEGKAEAFRAQSGVFSSATSNTNLSTQQLGDLNAQLALARTAQADAQAKARLIRETIKQGRLADVPDVANNELIRRLSEQRISLKGQLALESRTLLPGHPRIKELNAQLADLDTEIRVTGDKTARTLENDARLAGARFDNLQATLDQQKKNIGNTSGDDVRQRQYDSTARLLREQLESATSRYQDAVARQGAASTTGDARVISRAVQPQLPSFPKKVPLIGFATIAGFILSLAAVVATELLAGRAFLDALPLRQRAEPLMETDLVPESEVVTVREPHPVFAAADPTSWDDPSPVSDALAGVVQRIADGADGAYAIRVLVTAIAGSFETGATAVAIGRELAHNKRAVLVDVASSEVKGADTETLTGLLAGQATFSSVIDREAGSRLHVITGIRADVADKGFDVAIEALSQTYDFVVVSAALMPDASTLALAPHADFVVLGGAQVGDDAWTDALATLRHAGAGEILALPNAAGRAEKLTAA